MKLDELGKGTGTGAVWFWDTYSSRTLQQYSTESWLELCREFQVGERCSLGSKVSEF